MPGRYERPSRPARGAGHAQSRGPRSTRLLGFVAGAVLIAVGAFTVIDGDDIDHGDTDGASDVLADSESADGGTDSLDGIGRDVRDTDGTSRSADRSRERDDDGSREGDDDERPLPEAAPDVPFIEVKIHDDSEDEDSSESDEDSDLDTKPQATAPLPEDSGHGRRVVYDITGQQVWLVDEGNEVVHTYLVSGSRYDQLDEGTYEVFSKSEEAISWTYSETMRYMVRFHRGENSNIGFHDIPVYRDSGEEVQTLSELGTPLSDGCIRQDPDDAKALWDFAPVGTPVVVVRT
ncbi:murein L,D-transpeptidase [Actinobacteria bacterium YIM 96077]|uniref:L,D-TPase catalytic domain-containing protein n=1 Tax=Phytoactinopolyspora halophila TaxID=1981511 RepID=A0A329R365_9ACTN|nr:L,D-transpeptidase [Phytoactinopolyspora halophila]AYY11943.1 murein L,D-transpeptidase [Actinobacteria bacterium YIM 96077]RAW18823.1 hypothetical protein DPM12_01820 [Phytoactinopolyspora halophila]